MLQVETISLCISFTAMTHHFSTFISIPEKEFFWGGGDFSRSSGLHDSTQDLVSSNQNSQFLPEIHSSQAKRPVGSSLQLTFIN